MSQFTFDATQVAPSSERGAVPAGTYSVVINTSELKPGKKPTDRMLALSMKITDGPLQGQSIFQNLNVMHENPVAQQIAQERLSSICHAVNVLKINDTAQLHGRPFQIKVGVTPDNKYNELEAILRADGSSVTGAGSAATAPAAPAWATGQAPAAPTPASAAPAAPAPTPAPAPVAPPAPVQEKLFYVAKNNQNVTPTPIPQSQVMAQFGSELANVQICEVGGSAWVAGSTLASAPAPAASGAVPPWLANK